MTGEGSANGRTRIDLGFAVVIVLGVVAVTWVMVVIGLVSFGPGSATVATAVLGISAFGWVTTPYLPMPRVARWVGIAGVAIGSIILGVVVGQGTPPRAVAVERELEAIAAPFVDWEIPASSSRVSAPWEAPVGTLSGQLRSSSSGRPIEVVESELARQGFSVTALWEAASGPSPTDESSGPATVLTAERDRWQLRATIDDDGIWLRLAWTPLAATIDTFEGGGSDGLLGIGGFVGGVMLHWVAAVISFLGVIFTLASAGLGAAAVVGWLSRRRDRRSTAGGGAEPGRSGPPDPLS